MAAKAVRIASGNTTYLPITTSDLVQMNGTSQSLTTYINNIKNSVSNVPNTAKASLSSHVYNYTTQTVYTYISPTGEKDEINGSTLELRKGDNISLSQNGNIITISASDANVSQYLLNSTDISKWGLITRPYNISNNNANVTSGVGFTNTSFAYVTPARSYLYSKYTYSDSFIENGEKLEDKYLTVNGLDELIYLKYVNPEYNIIYNNNATSTEQLQASTSNGAYLNLVRTNSERSESVNSIYLHGKNGVQVGFTGGVGLLSNLISDITITYIPDHIGSGTAGKLTYWSSNDNHSSVTASYGSNTTNSVGLHYINAGVLKNVSATVGANDTPTYVSEGTIKPITTFKVTQKSLENNNTNKYPFLTKSNTTTTDITNTVNFTSNNTASAYYCASGKYAYLPYAYSTEFTENGQKLFNKYTTYAYLNSKLSNVTGKLDFTVVRNVMDAITIFNV